ncbi:hypothetical protein CMO83_04385 [Candidatus Woesearchaeota archaeon]|jgi:dienelactone hydrolase|nr:hypothetical protein [Candidatus Woesearchaeota archaeon]|tara:strand:+ start:10874 stop:11656 length:783 start_codon:yes stop_codon:yes gene_type:complete
MITEDLNPELRARLTHTGNPQDKLTMIYLPGLGTTGKSFSKVLSAQRRLQTQGIDLSVVTFIYGSHQGEVLQGFADDSADLGQLVDELEARGITRERIGFFGLCYGSHVAAQYLSTHDDVGFAVMIEPYLGADSLRSPFKEALNLLKSGSGLLGNLKLPLKRIIGREAYLDLQSFAQNDGRNVDIEALELPILTIGAHAHKFIDPDYGFLRETTTHSHIRLNASNTSRQLVNTLDGAIGSFLQEVYAYRINTPSETSPAH